MKLVAMICVALLVSSAQARFHPESDVVAGSSPSWKRTSNKPYGKTLHTLSVSLKIEDQNLKALEKVFMEVSTPTHAKYGRHLSIGEITDILAVPHERVQRVVSFLQGSGAENIEILPNRDMIKATMPIASWEKALQTEIHEYAHEDRKSAKVLRAHYSYSVPDEVADDIVMVGELLQFPRFRDEKLNKLQGSGSWSNACSNSGCNGLVTPAVLAERYNLPNASETQVNAKGNAMAVAEFQGQYFKQSDLDSFGSACHRDIGTPTVVGGNQNSAGVEAELDIEYIRAVAPEIPLTVVYNSQYSLLDWVNQISADANTPYVHSVSYGNDEKQQSSVGYMMTCNTAFMKAGARGISILFASGDQGVCGREGCGLGIFAKKSFKPDFPGGSPYITAVGGTNFVGSDIGDEEVWNNGGGGFSNTFGIPSWQADAVKAYKARSDANLPPQDYWNNTGRGYPDVSALGGTKTPYCVTTSGAFEGVAGTSASSPVVAGIFAKLNGVRLAAGKAPLGFLNPFIYSNTKGFNDVKSGVNNAGTKYGFTATEGWDAASGWGTPNFEVLKTLV